MNLGGTDEVNTSIPSDALESVAAADSTLQIIVASMGILALINLLVIIMLFPVGLRVLNDYREQLEAGAEHPTFDPEKFSDLDIDKSAWKFD